MTSIAQHNFAAMQLQLQTLQLENSALTKDVCLKENYIQLKDQQFRVMQKRLEDLESAVATWKDKYLEQLNRVAPSSSASAYGLASPAGTGPASTSRSVVSVNPNDDNSNNDNNDNTTMPTSSASMAAQPLLSSAWTPWQQPVGDSTASHPAATALDTTTSTSTDASDVLAQARPHIAQLSAADRLKLAPLLAAVTNSHGFAEALASTQWAEVFLDVSPELETVLLRYLLPALIANNSNNNINSNHQQQTTSQQTSPASSVIECSTRTSTKQTIDVRIVRRPLINSQDRGGTINSSERSSGDNASSAAIASTASRTSVERTVVPPETPAVHALSTAFRLSLPPSSSSSSLSSSSSVAAASTLSTLSTLSPPSTATDALLLDTSDASSSSSSSSSTPATAAIATEPVHVFDCIECITNNSSTGANGASSAPSKRTIAVIAHGPRELHPTKAAYISTPLPNAPPNDARDASASGRYSLTPSRASTMQSNASTTMDASMSPLQRTSLDSPFASSGNNSSSSSAGLSVTDWSSNSGRASRASGHSMRDGDRRSGASAYGSNAASAGSGSSGSTNRSSATGSLTSTPSTSATTTMTTTTKDGKIKKVLGSVMDRLHRHKPLPSSTSSSSYTTRLSFDSSHDDSYDDSDTSICDGCGRSESIASTKWICRTCRVLHADRPAFVLCSKCYGHGLHGLERDDALFRRIEDIVVAKCSRLATEHALRTLLRVGVCKTNVKKFSFCLTWIADLLQCKHTTDLRARALEISQIAPHVRSEFVRLLTDLLARYRPDIALTTEWQPMSGVVQSAVGVGSASSIESSDSGDSSATLQFDTLRIWVKDTVNIVST